MTPSSFIPASLLLIFCTGTAAYFTEYASKRWWLQSFEGGDEDMQVVYLPALLPREAQLAADRPTRDAPLPYNFNAFGRNFELQLVPNRKLVSSGFRVWSERGQEPALSAGDTSCHFQNAGGGAVAALSACKDHSLHGLIVVENSTYEVHPLAAGLGGGAARTEEAGWAHVIRRARTSAAPPPPPPSPRRPRARAPPAYTIEIALFLDEAAYKIFSPLFNYNEVELRDMLLAYINGVQALYQHASLGARVQLSLVRLTLLRAQPAALAPHGERGRLLDAFCAYQRALNAPRDADPQHWDMALLLTGADLYAEEGGRRSGVTMGLAPVGGVCLPAHACVVAEFGAGDALGRPYPSAGFTSVYILAHEIGHNLGMHHDGVGNACPRDGHIMSPSRGTSGEATWSACSAAAVANLRWATCLLDGAEDTEPPPEPLHHEKYLNAPGALWGAKRQCEVLLRDAAAAPWGTGAGAGVGEEGSVCAQLACRSPHRAGLYYAGPALPGTACGHRRWCQGGECVPEPAGAALPVGNDAGGDSSVAGSAASEDGDGGGGGDGDGWGSWRAGACRSGCSLGSRGTLERRRDCRRTDNTTCEGSSYEVMLCDDTKVCGKKRRVSAAAAAGRRACSQLARVLPRLDARAPALQAPHDPSRMWMGCAVFCRRGAGGYYAPRAELLAAGLDAYFPDGTWCHHDGRHHYYCRNHHCLPENFKLPEHSQSRSAAGEGWGGPLDARARSADPAGTLRTHLPLGEDGLPLQGPGDEDHDYIDITR